MLQALESWGDRTVEEEHAGSGPGQNQTQAPAVAFWQMVCLLSPLRHCANDYNTNIAENMTFLAGLAMALK